jgi:outer membrane protein
MAMGERRRGWATTMTASPVLAGIVLAILALAPAHAGAQPVVQQELTAEQSVRLGLERSARVRAAEADAAAAAARAREARAGLLPAVRVGASYTRLGGDIPEAEFRLPGLDTTFTLIPIELDRYHSEVSVEQPLFAGGRLRAGYRAAEREAAAAEWAAEEARADVALEVRRAYWTLHGAMAALEATEASLAQVDGHLLEVRRRFEEGALLRADLLAAETRRSEVLLERVETRNAVRVARLELSRLLGLGPDTEVVPTAALAVDPLPRALAGLPDRAVAARPELRALAEQVEALRAQESAARGGLLPEVGFVGRYIYSRPNPYAFMEQDEFLGTWEAGVSLRWGLFEGGARRARAAQARELRRAAEARLEDARELVVVDVSRHYLEAERATEALAVAAQVVEQAEEALRVTRQQFAEGAALPSQVLEAEAAYRGAGARQARARAEHAIARAALLRALGEW